FTPPPPEIGEVVSAFTTLKKNVEPMAPGARMAGALVGGAVGLVIGVVIALNIKAPALQVLFPVGLAGLGLGIVLLCTGFKHSCTYVGKEGAARFTCRGSREGVTGDVFCF